MAAKRQRQRTGDYDEQLQHAPIVAGVDAKINRDEFWRGSGQRPRSAEKYTRASGVSVR
jgi:hypothetical protein